MILTKAFTYLIAGLGVAVVTCYFRTRKYKELENVLNQGLIGILFFTDRIGVKFSEKSIDLPPALAKYPADLVGQLIVEITKNHDRLNLPSIQENIASFLTEHVQGQFNQEEILRTIGESHPEARQAIEDLVNRNPKARSPNHLAPQQ